MGRPADASSVDRLVAALTLGSSVDYEARAKACVADLAGPVQRQLQEQQQLLDEAEQASEAARQVAQKVTRQLEVLDVLPAILVFRWTASGLVWAAQAARLRRLADTCESLAKDCVERAARLKDVAWVQSPRAAGQAKRGSMTLHQASNMRQNLLPVGSPVRGVLARGAADMRGCARQLREHQDQLKDQWPKHNTVAAALQDLSAQLSMLADSIRPDKADKLMAMRLDFLRPDEARVLLKLRALQITLVLNADRQNAKPGTPAWN